MCLVVGQAAVVDEHGLLGDQGRRAVAVARVRRHVRGARRARQRGRRRGRSAASCGSRRAGWPTRTPQARGHHPRGGARVDGRAACRSAGSAPSEEIADVIVFLCSEPRLERRRRGVVGRRRRRARDHLSRRPPIRLRRRAREHRGDRQDLPADAPTRSAARRSASTRTRSARPTRCTSTSRPPGRPGYADVVAPPMFAVVYAGRAITPALFDPEVGIDFAHDGPRRPGVQLGAARRRRRRDRRPRPRSRTSPSAAGWASTCSRPMSRNQRGETVCTGIWTNIVRERISEPRSRATRSSSRSRPTAIVTVRYAGASGDFNPIHIDEEFARRSACPGRILHGLWTMAQVARAHTDAAGGPDELERLSVQFRGMGGWRRRSSSRARSARSRTGSRSSTPRPSRAGQRIIRNAAWPQSTG